MSIYGVSTANPFDILDEDYEPEPIPTEDTPDVKARPTQTTRPPPQSDRRGRGRGRGGRRGEAGGPRTHTEEGEFGGDTRTSRGGRIGRGNRGGGPPVFRGKREYDRRDGTGRGHELEKRQGGGKGNWGVSTDSEFTQTDELNTIGGQSPEDVASPGLDPASEGDGGVKTAPTEEAPEGEDSGEKKEQEEVKIEEKQVFTLAEYEEMMKEKDARMVPSKKEVPVVDTKQFDGMAVLKKSEEGSGFEALEVERIRKKKEKREKEVSTVEVFFKVGEPVRRGRGRGRGGRSRDFDAESPGQKWSNGTGPSVQDVPRYDPNFGGGGGGYPPSRGRRGRRGGRASYGEQASRQSGPQGVDISSENAFPALS